MNTAPASSSPRALYFVLVILLLGGAGLAYWNTQLRHDLATAQDELAQLRAVHPTPEARIPEPRVTEADVPALTAPPEPLPAAAAPPRSIGSLAAELMKSPGMRDMLARSQAQALERRWRDLMDHLQLSPEDRTRFIDLLSEKQTAATEAGLKLVSGNLTPEERTALTQQVKDANAVTDAKIHDFLGNDANNAYYQDYAALQPVRTQVTALNASLATAGQPMSDDQANALTGIMADTRKNFTFSSDPDANPDPQTALSGSNLDTYFREQEQLQSQIADRAATVLTPDQLAIFRQSQATRLETTKRSMNMAREMMGVGAGGK